MRATYLDATRIGLSLDEGEILATAVGPGEFTLTAMPGLLVYDALVATGLPIAPAPAPPLSAVSDRQFFQALADASTITQAEALAAVMTGTLPAGIEAAVEGLPEAERFAARMLLSGATTFERGHPMVAQLGAALGYDAAALDALWRRAATL